MLIQEGDYVVDVRAFEDGGEARGIVSAAKKLVIQGPTSVSAGVPTEYAIKLQTWQNEDISHLDYTVNVTVTSIKKPYRTQEFDTREFALTPDEPGEYLIQVYCDDSALICDSGQLIIQVE